MSQADRDDLIEQLNQRLEQLRHEQMEFKIHPPDETKSSNTSNYKIKEPTSPSSTKSGRALSKGKARKSISSQNTDTSASGEDEVLRIIRNSLAGKPIVGYDSKTYLLALEGLLDKRQVAQDKRRIREGVKINKAIRAVEDAMGKVSDKETDDQFDTELQRQIEELEGDMRVYDLETKKMIQEFYQKKQKAKQLIIDSQNDDLLDLQEHWSTPAKQRLFNRASHQLTELRKRQELCLNRNAFEDADKLRVLIHKLEKEESERATENMQIAYNQALDTLQQKHIIEMENFNISLRNQLTSLKNKRAMARRQFEYRRQKIIKQNEELRNKPNANKTCITSKSLHVKRKGRDKLKDRVFETKRKDYNTIVLKPIVFKTPSEIQF